MQLAELLSDTQDILDYLHIVLGGYPHKLLLGLLGGDIVLEDHLISEGSQCHIVDCTGLEVLLDGELVQEVQGG